MTTALEQIQADMARYSPNLSGIYVPARSKLKESASRAVQVTPYGIPATFEQHVKAQLEQSRRRYFIFQELYRQDTWTRAVVDYQVRQVNKGTERIVDEQDPLNPDIRKIKDFFRKPNPRRSHKMLRRGITQDLLVHGQGFWFIEHQRGGEPHALWPMDSRITMPITDLHGTVIMYAQVYNGQVVLFDTHEVVYLDLGNNGSTPAAVSPLESLVNSIAMELNANKYNAMLFQNNLNIGAIFSIPNADDEEIEKNKEFLRDQYASPENAHRPLILKGDAKLLRDGALAIKDINFAELISLARERVCAVYGVNESLIGVTSNVNRSEGETQERITYVNTCLPLRELINEGVTHQLIQDEDNFNSPNVRMDVPFASKLPTPGQLEGVGKAADIGTWTFNELRQMAEADEVANGDVFVMKIPGPGGFARPDLQAVPGLGDPTFDLTAYQLQHEQQAAQTNEMALNGMQAPTPATPYIPPRPQDQLQLEPIAQRIINVARSEAYEEDVPADAQDAQDEDTSETYFEIGGVRYVARRNPVFPGTRGGSPYTTSTGGIRYGPQPKGKQPPINAPSGEPNQNTLTNPKDPNTPKALTPEEKGGVDYARGQVQGLLRQAQQDNWTDAAFMDALEKDGWVAASGTQERFYDMHDAQEEARRLTQLHMDNIYTVLGSGGQYFIMEHELAPFIQRPERGTPSEGTQSTPETRVQPQPPPRQGAVVARSAVYELAQEDTAPNPSAPTLTSAEWVARLRRYCQGGKRT